MTAEYQPAPQARFQGMYWRQLTVTVGMVLLTLALLGITFFTLSYQYARAQISVQVQERAESMSRMSVRYLERGRSVSMEKLKNDADFQRMAGFAAGVSDVQFLLCGPDGIILFATEDSLSGGPLSVPADVARRVLGGERVSLRGSLDGLFDEPRLIAGVRAVVEETGEPVGLVFAVSSTTAMETMWRGFTGLFFMTALAVMLIAALAASISAMRLVRPLRSMVLATRRYAAGDFTVRMEGYDRDGEIGELAAAFNQMADSLQRQELQRREFISNVSHDLKTPLTTIAGYTDGILDGTIPPENERRYLRIISDESRRLNSLVRRMLDVSQLEANDFLRGAGRFDLCECMRRVLISLEKKITDRDLDVQADIPDGPILALGDGDMITQVIYNLLENAAKFARPGTMLYLGVAVVGARARVTVRNEGETIPPEELPRLFERFHKSDQSRSEDKDGVGLGLYIVKTILEQHRERIQVTSENGVTTFSFSLRTE